MISECDQLAHKGRDLICVCVLLLCVFASLAAFHFLFHFYFKMYMKGVFIFSKLSLLQGGCVCLAWR